LIGIKAEIVPLWHTYLPSQRSIVAMHFGLSPVLATLLVIAGWAGQQVSSRASAMALQDMPGPPGAMSQPNIDREVARLREALAREVPQHIFDTPDGDRRWIDRTKAAVEAAPLAIQRPQLLVIVDRNPAVQQMRIALAQPMAPWEVIGGTKVSTGQSGRPGYYITPVGVFLHTDDILDYRALGTYNENHIRGLGVKGMRVWDFGWQTAERGWGSDPDPSEIRLQMHATDPDYLERRLGRPASKGCIRVPAAMNRFLDRHGVLDADYERDARDDARLSNVLLPDRQPTPLAGDAMVVVDSST
jgi:hypothetical protein